MKETPLLFTAVLEETDIDRVDEIGNMLHTDKVDNKRVF
jgi:hypothetical protein